MDAKLFNEFVKDMREFCAAVIDSNFNENEALFLQKNIDIDEIARSYVVDIFDDDIEGMDEITNDNNKAIRYYNLCIDSIAESFCDICKDKLNTSYY